VSDYGEFCKDLREHKRKTRELFGKPCPKCQEKQPKREPTILLPRGKCKVDGYQDDRDWWSIGIELHAALEVARGLIVRHHNCYKKIEWGQPCPHCVREDGSQPEMDQIAKALEGSNQ